VLQLFEATAQTNGARHAGHSPESS